MAKEKLEKVHDFTTHKLDCKQCITVDINKTSTMANCCLKGAPLLRDYLNSLVAPHERKRQAAVKAQFNQQQDGSSQKTTRAKLKEVMRYK